MKTRQWPSPAALKLVFGTIFALIFPGCAVRPLPVSQASSRLDAAYESTLLGALLWLDDHQVRDRPGRGSSSRDASDVGDGCRQTARLHLPGGLSADIPTVGSSRGIRNQVGGWESEIHLFPARFPLEGRALVSTPDANLFNTAFVTFPCFLFDDSLLPESKRFISRMRRAALENLLAYRRGEAFNFWRVAPGVEGTFPRTGPLNVPMPLLRATAEAHRQPDFPAYRAALGRAGVGIHDLPLPPLPLWIALQAQVAGRDRLPPEDWIETCLDPRQNPTGIDAFFNIPNDADDTAAMAALLHLAGRPGSGQLLEILSHHRDLDRAREDGRDAWKGNDTGVFLTWLADEEQPPFSRPENGVIPLAVNNVDAVVNANALHAMALTGRRDLPGYRDAMRLVARCITSRHWPDAGLYYPQMMILPYAASRAWREGPARGEPLDAAMTVLLRDILDLQDHFARSHPLKAGAFPGGEDATESLSTALGLTALLNIGQECAQATGEETRYLCAIDRAAAYLMRQAKRHHLSGTVSWESGLFFSSSFKDLAHWRSEAFTTAMAVEALAKYTLDAERPGAPAAYRLQVDSDGAIRLTPSPVFR
jgi:hypothetical protein